MKRRDAIRLLGLSSFTLLSYPLLARLQESSAPREGNDKEATTWYIYDRIIAHANASGFRKLALGDCMGKIGMLLIGTAYAGGTLEGEVESCKVDFTGLDCVTFFENVLGISRVIKRGGAMTFSELVGEVTYTRYREGILDGYASRLHYTADWIQDNVKKEVVDDITQSIGGIRLNLNLNFMSQNSQLYPALVRNPKDVEKIKEAETRLNAAEHWYVPTESVRTIEDKLKTGDIIAIVTSKEGLDYAHTGLAYRDERGRLGLLHASAQKKRVYLDRSLSGYLKSVTTHTGITVVRPIEKSI